MISSPPWLTPFLDMRDRECRQHRWPDPDMRFRYHLHFKNNPAPTRADGCNWVTTLGPYGMTVHRLADLARLAEFYDHPQVAQVFWECVFAAGLPQFFHGDETLLVPEFVAVARHIQQTPARVVFVFPLRTIVWGPQEFQAWDHYDARAQALAGAACAFGPFQVVLRQHPTAPETWLLNGAYFQCQESEVSNMAAADVAQQLVAYANARLRQPDTWHPRGDYTAYRCRSVSLVDVMAELS